MQELFLFSDVVRFNLTLNKISAGEQHEESDLATCGAFLAFSGGLLATVEWGTTEFWKK